MQGILRSLKAGQREILMSEAGDHIHQLENNAAEQIARKNLQFNQQAANAMSEAQLQSSAQDCQ